MLQGLPWAFIHSEHEIPFVMLLSADYAGNIIPHPDTNILGSHGILKDN
jgi:hypothetical protein